MSDRKPITFEEMRMTELNEVIRRSSGHSKTANHFYHLRERLLKGQKLTKKMQENLAWIDTDVRKIMKKLKEVGL